MENIVLKNSSEKTRVGKVVCVGRNYAAHARELGNDIPESPILFLKTASCLIPSGEKVIHPGYSENLHHEIELVLLIGETVKNSDRKEAEKSVIGYAVGLDMTLRDIQNENRKKGEPWTLAKVFDTSGVLSEFVLKSDYHLQGNEKIFLSVNGKSKQESRINKMLFDPAELVVQISKKMTLEKGDIIFTGTPEGVSRVVRGDKLFGGIENVGSIETRIA